MVDFLFPAYCRHCGWAVRGGDWAPLLCAACGGEFPFHDAAVEPAEPLARAWALATFEGPARRLLIDLKYGGVLRAGKAIGVRMASAPGASVILDGVDAVVPVPLHWWRRWRRGHNQAAVLARALSGARIGTVYRPALRRARATTPQVGLPRERRLGNVAGAFRVRPRQRAAIAGAVVMLIDDVITTGATSAAAARALLDAGAAEVRAYAAAWAPD